MGQRSQIDLKDVLVIPLREEPQVAVVTMGKRLNDLLRVGFLGGCHRVRNAQHVRLGERRLDPGSASDILLPGADLAKQFLEILEP